MDSVILNWARPNHVTLNEPSGRIRAIDTGEKSILGKKSLPTWLDGSSKGTNQRHNEDETKWNDLIPTHTHDYFQSLSTGQPLIFKKGLGDDSRCKTRLRTWKRDARS